MKTFFSIACMACFILTIQISKVDAQTEQVLSLEQAVTIALKNNPGFAQQINGMKSAKVTVFSATGGFLPKSRTRSLWI